MTGGFGLIEETQGYVAVSEGLSGGSHVIVTSEPGEWFSVAEWLWGDTLVLQSHRAGPYGWPAVWTVQTDGSGLVELADGTLLDAVTEDSRWPCPARSFDVQSGARKADFWLRSKLVSRPMCG